MVRAGGRVLLPRRRGRGHLCAECGLHAAGFGVVGIYFVDFDVVGDLCDGGVHHDYHPLYDGDSYGVPRDADHVGIEFIECFFRGRCDGDA